ncbi:unnamed protein product [Triticum turgidum subsp. durum]|uniref:RING-type domain-containing protein n=1 Tax=Triticum turgidum subsp. durum TaxID=4567 RepID=A0A9R0VR89_TRITD|nr:unnamed protein product [Triticum turgidum subsp. durum]
MLHGGRPLSLRGSLKALEADIHHANTLAHAIHRAYGGTCVQMRLSYSTMAPIILNLIQWMDCSCSLSYTLPSYLGLLEVLVYKVYVDGDASISTIERRASLKEFYADDKDAEREDECGICLETCTKMVLPNCNHAMCINCYRDWYTRSQSCPFCRGSLKRVQSRDLWVLTGDEDVIDPVTLEKENVRHFHSFIDSLPLIVPDNLLLVYYDYLV